MARFFVTQLRVQNHVEMKLHDKQVLKVGCAGKPSSLIDEGRICGCNRLLFAACQQKSTIYAACDSK